MDTTNLEIRIKEILEAHPITDPAYMMATWDHNNHSWDPDMFFGEASLNEYMDDLEEIKAYIEFCEDYCKDGEDEDTPEFAIIKVYPDGKWEFNK